MLSMAPTILFARHHPVMPVASRELKHRPRIVTMGEESPNE